MKNRLIVGAFVTLLWGACWGAVAQPATLPLNGPWRFCVDSTNVGSREGWANGLPTGQSRAVNVPHTWNIDAGLETYTGSGWYERTFELAGSAKNKAARLQFDGIYHDAQIWLNGTKLGEHRGSGYNRFYMDAAPALRPGLNRLVVWVNNEFSKTSLPYLRSFDWANDGGIYRSVALQLADKPALDVVQATAQPDQNGGGTLRLALLFQDKTLNLPNGATLHLRVREENQATTNVIYEGTRPLTIRGGQAVDSLRLPTVNRWHFDAPNLYQVEATVRYRGKPTDSRTFVVGFRTIAVQNAQILLNGEPVRLAGMEWMPGSDPALGMAEPRAVLEKNLRALKGLNAVFTRFHWQQDEAVFDWCDRHGLLVQEEVPMWGGFMPPATPELIQLAQFQGEEMVRNHHNHPSIIAWGVGNEYHGHLPQTQQYVQTMYRFFKTLDPTRLVNYVSNTLQNNIATDATMYGDVLMWNEYYESWFGGHLERVAPVLDSIHLLHPTKPLVISEYGHCEPRFKGGDVRRIEHFYTHQELYNQRPYIAGTVYFSYNDYRTFSGEGGAGKYRERVHGVSDLTNNPKPSANFIARSFAPVRLLDVNANPKEVTVVVRAENSIPAYTARHYRLQLVTGTATAPTIDEPLPDMEPGQSLTKVFKAPNGPYALQVVRPTGEVVFRTDVP